MGLAGHVYLATKKEDVRPERRVVAATEQRAESWLRDECERDPTTDEVRRDRYSKLVLTDVDTEQVVGTVEKIPTRPQYEQLRERFLVDRTEADLREQAVGVLDTREDDGET